MMVAVEQFDAEEATIAFLGELKAFLFNAFGDSFTEDDWNHGLNGRHFAISEDEHLLAFCAVTPRTLYVDEKPFRCGYLENVASAPDKRHQGFASMVVNEANRYIAVNFEFGGLSTSKHEFYRKLGWKVWLGPTFVLTNGNWRSSESENGGIMILETGAAPNFDLQARIACEVRTGDDW